MRQPAVFTIGAAAAAAAAAELLAASGSKFKFLQLAHVTSGPKSRHLLRLGFIQKKKIVMSKYGLSVDLIPMVIWR